MFLLEIQMLIVDLHDLPQRNAILEPVLLFGVRVVKLKEHFRHADVDFRANNINYFFDARIEIVRRLAAWSLGHIPVINCK